MLNKKSSLTIIDGYSFVFRAYYSLPPLTNKDGIPVGAIYGFANMLYKVWKDSKTDLFAVVFDAGKITFRNEIYPEYKANRPDAPDDLRVQFPLVRKVTEAMNISTLDQVGVEADDIIATLVELYPNVDITIYSGDKDLMQLVNDRVKMYDPLRKKTYGIDEVKEKFGVFPTQLLDYLSLVGDRSDNIPGVPSIGAKTASELLNEYTDLENIYHNLDKIPQARRRNALEQNKDLAHLSKRLVTLKNDVELNLSEDQLIKHPLDAEKFRAFCTEYNFNALLSKINPEPQTTPVTKQSPNITSFTHNTYTKKNDLKKLEVLIDQERLFLHLTYGKGKQLHIFTDSSTYSIALSEQSNDLFGDSEDISVDDLIPFLTKLFVDKSISKICMNFKRIGKILVDLEILNLSDFNSFIIRRDFLDLEAIDYLVDKNNDSSLDLKKRIELLDKNKIELSDAVEDIPQKYPALLQILQQENLLHLYYSLDFPTIVTLLRVEYSGFKVSLPMLASLSKTFGKNIAAHQSKIYELAGEEFNIASPKQLGEILYEKLGLTTTKKSAKTKAKSTSVEVLEEFARNDNQIAREVLSWRHFSKLKSTYTDSLQQLADNNSRIHTNFSSTTTSTGRLSSSNPNLQNIPVRTEDGDKIRQSFIHDTGNVLISADYSQIELRLLAHIGKVKTLRQAFLNDQDIHKATAMEVFGIREDEVNSEYRRKAKTINFGIIYGISAFGLAERLNISRTDAKEFIKEYFNKFAEIKEYMDDTISFCKEHGYVKTLHGRKIYFPNINHSNGMLRSITERAVINAPLQGSAADIIKKAMLDIEANLLKAKLDINLILQVHDELIYEVSEEDALKAQQVIKSGMENCIKLSIPLKVDANIGNSWQEIH